MRMISFILLAFLLLSPSSAIQAQDNRPGAQTGVVVPSGFETFFDSLHELLQKYPAAARRFAITDKEIEGRPGFQNKNPTFQTSLCPGGQMCSKICDEGHLVCCGTCHEILK